MKDYRKRQKINYIVIRLNKFYERLNNLWDDNCDILDDIFEIEIDKCIDDNKLYSLELDLYNTKENVYNIIVELNKHIEKK